MLPVEPGAGVSSFTAASTLSSYQEKGSKSNLLTTTIVDDIKYLLGQVKFLRVA
jgi:hypothetical protein